jgi:type I restriction enzyme S subunit
MCELPNGWVATTLGELGEWRGGGTPQKSRDDFWRNGTIPWVSPKDIKRTVIDSAEDRITESALLSSATQLVPAGSVLLVTRSGILQHSLPVATNSVPVAINQDLKALTPTPGVNAAFLAAQLRAFSQEILAECSKSGTTVESIDFAKLKNRLFLLAPEREQQRIISKLDGMLARTARAKRELDRGPVLIAKLKEAIYAAAFSGELTREWRESHNELTSPDDRLEEIAKVRDTLTKERKLSLGRTLNSGEAGRIPVDLGAIPESWAKSTLEAITNPVRVIQYGILKPGPNLPNGVPYVKVINIKGGKIELDAIKQTSSAIHKQYSRSSIKNGDILLSIRGTVGRLGIVPAELDGGNITQDSVRIDVLPLINKHFVYWYLHSPAAQEYFRRNQKGVAVRGINVGDVRPMEIPLPPLTEQEEIVRRIEKVITWLETLSTKLISSNRILFHLEQNILLKAFQGELVPQNPDDEPASALLERIRANQNLAYVRKRSERKTRGGIMATPKQQLIEDVSTWPEGGLGFEELIKRIAGDYESVRTALFELMSGSTPVVRQQFDKKHRRMMLKRVAA